MSPTISHTSLSSPSHTPLLQQQLRRLSNTPPINPSAMNSNNNNKNEIIPSSPNHSRPASIVSTPIGTRPSSPSYPPPSSAPPTAPAYQQYQQQLNGPSSSSSSPSGLSHGSSSYYPYHSSSSSSSSSYIPQGPLRHSRPNTPSSYHHLHHHHHHPYNSHYSHFRSGGGSGNYLNHHHHHHGSNPPPLPPPRQRPLWAVEQEKELERYQSEEKKLIEEEIKVLAGVRKGRFDLEVANWETSKLEHQLDLVQKQWNDSGMDEIVKNELSNRLHGSVSLNLTQKVVL
ncbi:unnamed protein product [Cunninghamella echinulata]